MIQEIREIPTRAEKVYYATKNIALPEHVPYLGMGSSYFATLVPYYLGIPIHPKIASEYFNYLSNKQVRKVGVLISQSGKSSEVLWCRELFHKFYAITNEIKSPLCISTKVERVFPLLAGKEEHSSSKTYVNTLITLYNGLGIDPFSAVNTFRQKMKSYENWGIEVASQLYELMLDKRYKGTYIIGNGPNIATALQASLILSETTKHPFIGMSVAQYDHGPKETAQDSAVIVIRTQGPAKKRTDCLFDLVEKAGANVFYYEENEISEELSPIGNVIPFYFMAHHLAKLLKIKETFAVGSKITQVEK